MKMRSFNSSRPKLSPKCTANTILGLISLTTKYLNIFPQYFDIWSSPPGSIVTQCIYRFLRGYLGILKCTWHSFPRLCAKCKRKRTRISWNIHVCAPSSEDIYLSSPFSNRQIQHWFQNLSLTLKEELKSKFNTLAKRERELLNVFFMSYKMCKSILSFDALLISFETWICDASNWFLCNISKDDFASVKLLANTSRSAIVNSPYFAKERGCVTYYYSLFLNCTLF